MWIELHDTLPDHPKLACLADALGVSRVTAMGHITTLWLWSARYCEDGNLTRYGARSVAEGAKWDGDPEVFVSALVKSRFCIAENNNAIINGWAEYIGRLMEKREQNRDRKRKSRAGHAPVTGLPTIPTIPTEPTTPAERCRVVFDAFKKTFKKQPSHLIAKPQDIAGIVERLDSWLKTTPPQAFIADIESFAGRDIGSFNFFIARWTKVPPVAADKPAELNLNAADKYYV